MNLAEHPTVKRFHEKPPVSLDAATPLDGAWLRQLVLEAGADDVGFVPIDHPDIADQRDDILSLFPAARTLVSFVRRMNRENLRTPARATANLEFHRSGDQVNDIAHATVEALERRGISALNPAMGFPMEMDRFPGKIWSVSHKPVAVAAGLGKMGIHRNVIHPVFGNFILLGTVVVGAAVTEGPRALDYNPCLECKLCVSACPVGAIGSDGHFNFSACYTHNYREFMGGFTSWVETIAESRTVLDYRAEVSDSESASMWQSLSFGANYKAAYCMAVCPAGEDVIAPFLTDRKEFLASVVKPLQEKHETIYVIPGSDAEAHVARRFPHKQAKRVRGSLRPRSIDALLQGLPLTFQRMPAKDMNVTYHFSFVGSEQRDVTVRIHDQQLEIHQGHVGTAHLKVVADTATWLGFVAKERSLVWALVTRKIRMKGSPRLLVAFGKCFPS